jgi:NAD+ diphosphatase
MSGDNHFAGGAYLDRRVEARLAPDWFDEARRDPRALCVAMRDGAALVRSGLEEGVRLALLGADDPRIAASLAPERVVLLGWYEERRCLLVDLPADAAQPREGEAFAELRPLAAELPAGEAALAAYARALHLWHANHRFCGHCGAPTVVERAGHARRCTSCGQTGFPRIDPAVIVLAHDGERVLLGRQASWPPGRYSTIAGFVEPGESLEDAVRRELREETGVEARHIAYHSSQPWPFPSSLMLGFVARVKHATPQLNDGELEDARWFTREELASGAVRLPPPHAISRRLIEDWVGSSPTS